MKLTLSSWVLILTFAFCSVGCIMLDAAADNADSPDVIMNIRIKDIARFHWMHDIQLIGYGLVVGLDGTGDSSGTAFTLQSTINMMKRFGIDVPRGNLSLKNAAAVMVTADLPFFAKAGGRIDVLVSSIGDAKSIVGGTLLPTPMTAPDGQMYVMAQGPISVGGFSISTGTGSNTQKNHPTVGRAPNGGMILRIPSSYAINQVKIDEGLQIILNEPDFTTATRLVSAINAEFQGAARAVDAACIQVIVPESSHNDLITFISRLENLMVIPDHVAEVVIDERTGTVVIGKDVRISPVAISHGNLSIQIKTEEEVSQPEPFSKGETTVTQKTESSVREDEQKMKVIRGGASIDEVVQALNLIGVSPRDMITILQAIKQAGALHARLVIM